MPPVTPSTMRLGLATRAVYRASWDRRLDKEVRMTIKAWPAAERPREKLLDRGAAALTDAELLALLLRTGSRGQTALDLARGLLTRFGSLRALLAAERGSLAPTPGVGPAKYAELMAAAEIGRRQLGEALARGAP